MKTRIIHCLGRLNTGGAETLVMNILRNIDRNKYQFDFLVFSDLPGFYDEEVKKFGSNIYYLPSISKVGLWKYMHCLVSFFNEQKIDVVHSHMDWLGGFISYAAYKAGVKKIIVHSHANQKMFDKDILHHLLISFNKRLISKYATDRLACSEEAGESLFNKEFIVLENGIDLNKFISPDKNIIEKLKKDFNIKENEIILGCVGSLSDNKNQSFLIQLLYELRKVNQNYRLILVGDGAIKDKLMQLTMDCELSNHVLFTGVRSEIPEIMHLFDVFLFPSKMEGLGIVAIEAQASGIPCIVSNTVPKTVDIGLGLVDFTELNIEKWKHKIIHTFNRKVIVKSKSYIDTKFDINNVCNILSNIYLKEK